MNRVLSHFWEFEHFFRTLKKENNKANQEKPS